MKLRSKLTELAKVVAEYAERDSEFASRLEEVFGKKDVKSKKTNSPISRSKNRRPPAVLDPILVVKDGEKALRDELETLTLEQLRDIVADFSMDPGKLVMKWKDSSRVIDRIVEISVTRSQKGNAFRQ